MGSGRPGGAGLYLNGHGHALTSLAEVLLIAGRRAEAIDALSEATELFTRKGNRVMVERIRRRLADLV